MRKIDDVLNIPCRLSCKEADTDIIFDGVLTSKDNCIVFIGRTEVNTRNLSWNVKYTLCGEIESTPITLLNASIICMSGAGFGDVYHFVQFSPSEIIVGRSYACKEEEIKIKKISANIQALNSMFSSSPVEIIHHFSKENPALVNYTYPTSINATDDEGSLSIYQTIGLGWSKNSVELPIIPCIDYTFSSTASIRDGIRKIASVRNLFSFFSNDYIPLENITFSDEQSNDTQLCYNLLYLNFTDEIKISDRPFLITTENFSADFSQIWLKWCEFYSKKYIPTLFYEVICNRSSRINRFLNFSQAIEVFSVHYRNKEAEKIAASEGWKGKQVPLKYRFKDIIIFLNDFLELSPTEISNLAQALSDERNFFTHYNEKYDIPAAQELFSAGRVVHFMLLALVYRIVSLNDSAIKEAARFFSCGSLSNDIKIVLKQIECTQYDNMFD